MGFRLECATQRPVRTAGGPEAWLHQRPKLSQKPVVSHRVEEGGGPFLLIPASRAPSLYCSPAPGTRVSGSEEENPWYLPLPLAAHRAVAAILIVGEAHAHALLTLLSQLLLIILTLPRKPTSLTTTDTDL